MLKKIIIGLVIVVILIALAVMYKFNYLASKDGNDVDGNKITKKVSNFEECVAAGYSVMESYPGQCSDGKTIFTQIFTEDEIKNIGLESEQASQIPDFYKNLKVVKANTFSVEVSRKKKDCDREGHQKCLQVKKENGKWELFYDRIYGFNYEEGNYYILKIKEEIYDIKNAKNFPADVSDRIWKVIKIEKMIVPEAEKMTKTVEELFDKNKKTLIWDFVKLESNDGNVKVFLKKVKGYYGDNGFFWFRDLLNKTVFSDKKVKTLEVYVGDKNFNLCDLTDMMGDCVRKDWKNSRDDFLKKVELLSPRDLEMVVKIPRAELTENGVKVDFDEYSVTKSDKILTATLEKLFEIRSAAGNEEDDTWNGLKFKSVSVDKKIATINLSGAWFPEGDLSSFYFRQEIESAAMQFDTINEVIVKTSGKIFDWCVDDVSDGESGCPEKKQLWDTRNYGDEGIMMTIRLPVIGNRYGKYPTEWKEYSVPKSSAFLTMTLRKFFEVNKKYGLKFDKVSLKDKVAKIFLIGNLKLDGEKSGIIFQTEINGLAFQYPTVETVQVFLNNEVLDLCILGQESGCVINPWITNRIELVY